MKKIDIHTKKPVGDDDNRYSNSISPQKMKEHVYEQIDFALSEDQWDLIDEYFGEYWNNKVGIGGYFYWDEVAPFIYEKAVEQKILISKERVELIVDLMLSKIETDGGFME